MRVGWLIDDHGYIGGAEMTAAEFRAAVPAGVDIVDCLPGHLDLSCDAYVVHNAVQYHVQELEPLRGKRVVKYAHDVFPHSPWGSREWLVEHAEWVFCSPLQRERMGLEGHVIPPALNLDRLKPTRQSRRNGKRDGMVSIGQWRNASKGQQSLLEYAMEHGPVDVYGPGPFGPAAPPLDYKGPISPEQVPSTLWGYTTFVHLPWELEPFGRSVVEAWAAGCKLVVNGLVGATYWLEEAPERLRTASQDFWEFVCA